MKKKMLVIDIILIMLVVSGCSINSFFYFMNLYVMEESEKLNSSILEYEDINKKIDDYKKIVENGNLELDKNKELEKNKEQLLIDKQNLDNEINDLQEKIENFE